MSNEEQEEYVEAIADSEAMRRINFYALLDELEMYMADKIFYDDVKIFMRDRGVI